MNTSQLAMAGAFDDLEWANGSNQTGVTGSNNYSTPTQTSSSGGGFWDGANFMGLLSTIGGTWAQIEAAKKGNQVIVKDTVTGQNTDIAPMLLQKLEEQAKANQTSVDGLMQMMQMQMLQNQQANNNKPAKDNTALYVGLGVAGVVILGGILYMSSNKNKN